MEGVPFMRSALISLTIVLSAAGAQLSAASQCAESHPAVTVQIHDYARVKTKSLAEAEDVATRMYKRVGIGIEWLTVVHTDVADGKNATGAEAAPSPSPAAQLTINIVTPSMAKRQGHGDNVLGFVSVPPEGGMGRIGYIVYLASKTSPQEELRARPTFWD
jgi:hypothetical protein